MGHRLLVFIPPLWLCLLVVAGTACAGAGKQLPPEEALAKSAESFAFYHTYQLDYEVKVNDDSAGSVRGTVAYRDDAMHFGTFEVSGDFDEELDFAEALLIPPDAYVLTDGTWYRMTEADLGGESLFNTDEAPIDYTAILEAMQRPEQIDDETLAGEEVHRYQSVVDPADFPLEDAGLPASVPLDSRGTAELWIEPETFLPRKVMITLRTGGKDSMIVTYEISKYGESATPPEPPEGARPWRDVYLPQAPCTGDDFPLCRTAQVRLQPESLPSCEGSVLRVCLVPLGRVSPDLVRHLTDYFKTQYDLTVTILTPINIPPHLVNEERQQIESHGLSDYMKSMLPEEARDANAVLIGITPVDLFSAESPDWRYTFGVKGSPANPRAVFSTFRMDPQTYDGITNDELLHSRARKFMAKYVGLLYYGLTPSSDPLSPVYDSIGGVQDLDLMQEPLPVSPSG